MLVVESDKKRSKHKELLELGLELVPRKKVCSRQGHRKHFEAVGQLLKKGTLLITIKNHALLRY